MLIGLFQLAILFGLLFLSSCATVTPQDRKYEHLKTQVNSKHDSAQFSSNDPYLFTQKNTLRRLKGFARRACRQWPKTDQPLAIQNCNRAIGKLVSDALAQKYFAVNLDQVTASCRVNPRVCRNITSYEALFRRLHNSDIEKSREIKLNRLKAWRAGRIKYATLKKDLHLDG